MRPRSTWRALSLACALAVLLLTADCQPLPGMFPGLFGPPRPTPTPTAMPSAPATLHADRVVVFKRRRRLELVQKGRVVASFPVALGPHPTGAKREAGDGRTPEGRYRIDWRTADTRYTEELHISYPNAQDAAWARAHRVSPGDGIFIHGLPFDFGPYDPPVWYKDWTEGCISVGNLAIQKIWDAVPDGTPIDILP